MTQPNSFGPVHIAMSENCVYYTFQNGKRTRIGSIELYEPEVNWNQYDFFFQHSPIYYFQK